MKSLESFEDEKIEHKGTPHLKEIVKIQCDLMKEWMKGKEGNVSDLKMKWVETYAKKFREEVLNPMIAEQSYFWEDYNSDLFREKIMERIRDELYENINPIT